MKRLTAAAFALAVSLTSAGAWAQGVAGTANQPMHPDHGKAVITSVDNHNGLTPRARCIMLYQRHHKHLARHAAEDHCK